jgi:hypothetical protein
MTLATQMTTDLSVFFNTDEFAVSGTYTVFSSSATSTVSVIVANAYDLTPNATGMGAGAVITIKATDIAQPEVYDTITVSGVVYRVDSIISGDKDVWQLSCSTDQRPLPRGGA